MPQSYRFHLKDPEESNELEEHLMVVSRRSFMKKASLLVLATGVSLGEAKSIYGSDSLAGSLNPQEPKPLPKVENTASIVFAKSTFEPYVDTVFRITSDRTTAVKSILISVADIGPVPDQKLQGRECFVIKFRGTRPLPQDRYELEHAALGKFELFLVPAGKNRKRFYYQAVINRLNG
jgi:hypothetical protein